MSTIEPYRNELDKLNQQLQETTDVENRKYLIDLFSSKYLLLPNFWKLRLKYEFTLDYEKEKKLVRKAMFDFYSRDFYDSLDPMLKCHLCWEVSKHIWHWNGAIAAYRDDLSKLQDGAVKAIVFDNAIAFFLKNEYLLLWSMVYRILDFGWIWQGCSSSCSTKIQ